MNKVTIELDADYLNRICADLASELRHEMPGGHEIADDDFAAALDAWRKFSPRYVAHSVASERIAFERGFTPRLRPRPEIVAWHETIEETAALLETILQQLPQLEASLAR